MIAPPIWQLDGVSPHADATKKQERSLFIHACGNGGGGDGNTMLPVIQVHNPSLYDVLNEVAPLSVAGTYPVCWNIGTLVLVSFRSSPENDAVTAIAIHCPLETCNPVVNSTFGPLLNTKLIFCPFCVPGHWFVNGVMPAPQSAV